MKTHLETSPDDAVAVRLLHATTDTCNHARLSLSNFDQPTSDTDSSDDDVLDDGHGKNGTNGLAEKIKIYTHCLLDLSAALECPDPDAAQMDHAVAQPQHDLLPSAEKTDATLHPSADLTKWWEEPLQESWKDFLGLDDESMNSDSVLGFGSYTEAEPLEVPTPASVTKPTSDTKPRRVRTRMEDATRPMDEIAEVQQSEQSFPCPFWKAKPITGFPYNCTAAPMSTLSAVRTHLTQKLPGEPQHLPFLKLCPTCNQDILREVDFETHHGKDGLKCKNPRPHRKGDTGQQEQYDELCSQVHVHIAVEAAIKGMYTLHAKSDNNTNKSRTS